MSALPAEAGPYAEPVPAPAVPAPAAVPPRPRRRGSLRVVPAARPGPAPLAPFVAVVAGLLVAGLAALLVLNTLLAQDAFRIHDLEQANARLSEREQALDRRLAALESPGSVAERAAELGMVPSSTPLFLRLPDGAVLGAPPEGAAGSADPDAVAALDAQEGAAPGGDTAAEDSAAEEESTEESAQESTADSAATQSTAEDSP